MSRIGWVEYYRHRQRLQESLNINVGLYALQRCVEALLAMQASPTFHEPSTNVRGVEALLAMQASPHKRKAHVPYSESKLTLLLKGALGGGTRTTVLICARRHS